MIGDWDRALSGLGPVGPIARDRVRPEPEPAVMVEAELIPGMSETDTLVAGFRKLLDALGYESGWQAVPNPVTGAVKLRLAARRREG